MVVITSDTKLYTSLPWPGLSSRKPGVPGPKKHRFEFEFDDTIQSLSNPLEPIMTVTASNGNSTTC